MLGKWFQRQDAVIDVVYPVPGRRRYADRSGGAHRSAYRRTGGPPPVGIGRSAVALTPAGTTCRDRAGAFPTVGATATIRVGGAGA